MAFYYKIFFSYKHWKTFENMILIAPESTLSSFIYNFPVVGDKSVFLLFVSCFLTLSVQFNCSVMSDSLWSHGMQHARLPCPSTPRACSNSCPSSRWCHPTVLSSVIPFSCLQSFPALRSFPMSPFFASVGQSTGPSASASVLPMNIQDWFPLGLTGWISLPSKGLSRVFSKTWFKSISSSVLSFLYI